MLLSGRRWRRCFLRRRGLRDIFLGRSLGDLLVRRGPRVGAEVDDFVLGVEGDGGVGECEGLKGVVDEFGWVVEEVLRWAQTRRRGS